MNRRLFLKNTALAAGAAFFSGLNSGISFAGSSGKAAGSKRPNFIFILVDDLGCRDVGFMGSEFYQTPNLDKLAGEGMVFTDAYANAANCAPSRACFLTGQYSPRHGVYTVNSSARGRASARRLVPVENDTTLDTKHVTIAEAL